MFDKGGRSKKAILQTIPRYSRQYPAKIPFERLLEMKKNMYLFSFTIEVFEQPGQEVMILMMILVEWTLMLRMMMTQAIGLWIKIC